MFSSFIFCVFFFFLTLQTSNDSIFRIIFFFALLFSATVFNFFFVEIMSDYIGSFSKSFIRGTTILIKTILPILAVFLVMALAYSYVPNDEIGGFFMLLVIVPIILTWPLVFLINLIRSVMYLIKRHQEKSA